MVANDRFLDDGVAFVYIDGDEWVVYSEDEAERVNSWSAQTGQRLGSLTDAHHIGPNGWQGRL